MRIDRPGHLGVGIGHHEGRVVFVRGVLPTERVRVVVTEDKGGNFCRATLVEVINPSAHRRDPVCGQAKAGAGCCDLDFTTGAHARALKRTVLVDQLARIARVDAGSVGLGEVEPLGDHAGEVETRWRSRMRYAVDADGMLGIRARESGHIVPGVGCAQPMEAVTAAVSGLTATPGAEILVGVGDRGLSGVVELAPAARIQPRRDAGSDRRRRAQRHRSQAALPRGLTTLRGEANLEYSLNGRRFDVHVAGFWQAHHAAATVYSQVVADFAGDAAPSSRVVWDVYGGVGVLGSAVLDRLPSVEQLVVAEADSRALEVAQATFADDPRVLTARGPTARIAETLPAPDLVICDPPRSGAGAQAITAITDRRPAVIIHVGCDPASFARDVGAYMKLGYRLTALRAFDAFPLTHHVEAVGVLCLR